MELLRVENLSVTLSTSNGPLKVIQNVNFSMKQGESLGIVGESGCGKSVTALALISLLPPDSVITGKILLKGEDLLRRTPRQLCEIRGNRIGMIFQEPMTALNPVKTIGAQISESILLHLGLSKKEAKNRVTELMERVDLPVNRFPLNLYPHQLSGGQRQRVMIAMAIACEPDLLIADEPTTALDVTIQEQILDLIQELAESSKMALIMISHDLGVIAQTTEKVMVMYTGSVVETGRTVDVFHDMAHPYTSGLFSAIPRMGISEERGRRRLYSIPGQVPEPHERSIGCDFASRCARHSHICEEEGPLLNQVTESHLVWCRDPLPRKEG
jgi:peptide/nickel transport system ATP-binding protein